MKQQELETLIEKKAKELGVLNTFRVFWVNTIAA